MQLNKDYEPEINLRRLFFYVLYRWRSILTVALIGAVLLGGYKYLSLQRTTKPLQSVQQQDMQTAEEERELDRKIVEKAKQIEELDAYLKESVYINLNPQGIWTASCKYLVKAEPVVEGTLPQGSNIDPADSILPVYSYPLTDATAEELKEVFNTGKQEYVNELINTEINIDENSISVSVKAATKESAQKGMEYVQTKMESIAAKTQEINAHTLIDIGRKIVFTTDVTMENDPLSARKATLTKALDQYREDLQTLKESDWRYKPEVLIRFALFGFLIGALLMICLYAFRYILKDKLTDAEALSEQYRLPILGVFRRSSSIHNDKGLDKFISKWELGNNTVNEETTYDSICALMSDQQEAKNILLVSTLKEDKLSPVKEALSKRMEEKDIEAKGDFLADSEAITESAKASAVIIMEERDVSSNKDIRRMAETLTINQAKVIGAIVL